MKSRNFMTKIKYFAKSGIYICICQFFFVILRPEFCAYMCMYVRKADKVHTLRASARDGNMQNEEKDKNKEAKETRKMLRNVILLCVAVWAGGALITQSIGIFLFPSEDGCGVSAGLYGDSFGAVNALMSALAFAGVIVSLWLQRKEFELQRDDLKLQYEELKAQRAEFEQQNKTLKLQRFENTFFNMMQLQQQIVNDLHLQVPVLEDSHLVKMGIEKPKKMNELRGREVIHHIYDNALTGIANNGLKRYAHIPNRDLLDHYFRHLYTILRFVDESDVFAPIGDEQKIDNYEWKQKYRYTTILRATLSRYEMLILYYNGLSEFGREKLKPLIERYALLDNIDKYSLVSSGEYKEMLGFNPNTNRQWMSDHKLTWTDYEFYLTEETDNPRKYNIHAFGYGEAEVARAKQAIKNFQIMIEDRDKELGKKASE